MNGTRHDGDPLQALDEPIFTICALCGRQFAGMESMVGDVPLCHPDEGQDCYQLVTVYGHFVPGFGVWTSKGWETPSVVEP